MTLDDIYEAWSKDSRIDKTDVGGEAISIPKLHHKYHRMLSTERLVLLQRTQELSRLKLDKYEFLTFGPAKEFPKDWKLPPSGKVTKAEAKTYIDADPDVVEKSLLVGMQREKVEVLESIVTSINNRNFLLTNFINWEKLRNGIGG